LPYNRSLLPCNRSLLTLKHTSGPCHSGAQADPSRSLSRASYATCRSRAAHVAWAAILCGGGVVSSSERARRLRIVTIDNGLCGTPPTSVSLFVVSYVHARTRTRSLAPSPTRSPTDPVPRVCVCVRVTHTRARAHTHTRPALAHRVSRRGAQGQ